MRSRDIKEGETYMFVATDALERKKLEGQPFTVVEIKNVFRRLKFRGGTRKVKRFFNEEGLGARAEELEPMDDPVEDSDKTKEILDMWKEGAPINEEGKSVITPSYMHARPKEGEDLPL